MFDIRETKKEFLNNISSQEIDKLTDKINVFDINTILNFGNDILKELSNSSQHIINFIENNKISSCDEIMNILSKLMEQLDIKEIISDNNNIGFFKKFFKKTNSLDNILKKYEAMIPDLDKAFVKIKQYQESIKQLNNLFEKEFKKEIVKYQILLKYMTACDAAIKEINNYILEYEEKYNITKNEEINFDIMSLRQANNKLQQKKNDLHMAENISLQTLPVLKAIQEENVKLITSMDTSFLVTIPIFKETFLQFINLKRKFLENKALAAIDKKQDDILKYNENDLKQAKNKILNGIQETKIINNTSKKIIEELNYKNN